MAKIRDYAVSIVATAAASIAVDMPTHETGDLLLFFFNKDTASGGPATPSGWSTVSGFTNPLNSAGSGNYLFAKRAASSSESLGTVSYTSETSICIVIAIHGCYGSTVANAIANCTTAGSDNAATFPLGGGSGFTPTYNNSLVLGLLGNDAVSGPFCLPGWELLYGGDAVANSLAVSYTFQRAAASLTHPGYYAQTADDGRWALLAIRDDGTTVQVPAYVDRGTVPAYLLAPMVMVNVPDKGTWELTTNDITTITLTDGGASKTLTQLDPVITADTGYNPFLATTKITATSSTTVMYASQLRRTANDDLTAGEGVIFGTWRPTVPRDYLDMGLKRHGGVSIGIADASNNYRFWCIGAQLAKSTKVSDRQNYVIEVTTEDTDFAESATNPTLSAIQDWYLAGSGYYGACAVEWSGLYLLNNFVLAGGSPTNPMTFDEVVVAVNNGGGYMPYIEQAGAAGTVWVPLRFGGGEACHAKIELSVFQFPRKADNIRYLNAHISTDKHGVEFYGQDRGSGDVDTLNFLNVVFTSPTSYYWRFNAAHDADVDVDFTGSTVVGANVTLRSTVTLSGVAFVGCSTFTLGAANLSGCKFTNTKVNAATPAEAAGITTSTFVKNVGTQHALEIAGTAADITLTGNTFTGYAASNGSTGNEAIYVNIAAGSMTITISGGSTPSIRTAGCTVTVSSGATVTFTGLPTGCDIVVLTAGTSTILQQVDAHGSTSYGWGYSGTPTVDVGFIKPGYVPFYIRNLSLTTTDASIPVSLTADRNYTA